MMSINKHVRTTAAAYASGSRELAKAGTYRRMPDFDGINRAALARLPEILARWLPDGRVEGAEYVARNPSRADRRPGSFNINLRTGQWADFATDDQGGDPVSLAAYLSGRGQAEAARELAAMLGLDADG